MEQCPLGDKCFYADLDDDIPEFELLRGEWKPKKTLRANWVMGMPKPEDVARGRSVAWFYLSPRIQELLNDYKLTGWSTYSLELRDKSGEICRGYNGLSIVGRSGPIDEKKGRLALGQSADDCFAERLGMFFEESSWDGSDFFCPVGDNSYKFVTQRVVNLFTENNIGGFEFIPLTKAPWFP